MYRVTVLVNISSIQMNFLKLTFLLALDLGGGFSSSLSSEVLSSSEELSSSSLSLFSTLGAFLGALCLGGALFF